MSQRMALALGCCHSQRRRQPTHASRTCFRSHPMSLEPCREVAVAPDAAVGWVVGDCNCQEKKRFAERGSKADVHRTKRVALEAKESF